MVAVGWELGHASPVHMYSPPRWWGLHFRSRLLKRGEVLLCWKVRGSVSDHVLDTTARSLIVDLLKEASRLHVRYVLCLVELVRAVKWPLLT
jgi:hypothetical protein